MCCVWVSINLVSVSASLLMPPSSWVTYWELLSEARNAEMYLYGILLSPMGFCVGAWLHLFRHWIFGADLLTPILKV